MRLEHLVKECEKLYNSNENDNTAFLLVLRYIEEAYFYANKSLYLKKALEIAEKRNDELIFQIIQIYVYIEFNYINQAEVILKKILKFKHYYRFERTKEYALVLLLQAFKAFKKGNLRKVSEFLNETELLLAELKGDYTVRLLLAFCLKNFVGDKIRMEKILYSFKDKNCRSPLFYSMAGELLTKAYCKFDDCYINRIFKWKVYNADSKEFLENFKYLKNLNESSLELFCEKVDSKEALLMLGNSYIKNRSYSLKAFEIYSLLRKEKLILENLDYYYFYAAFKNGVIENVDIQSIQKIKNIVEMEDEFVAYLYFLIIYNRKSKYLSENNKEEIVKFGENAFSKSKMSIYYNSIYKFMIENGKGTLSMEKYVFENLFAYEVKILNPKIKYIWVDERDKNKIESYLVKGNLVIINSASDDFNVYCLGNKQRGSYKADGNIVITKKIIDTDLKIIKYFKNKSYSSEEFIINAAKIAISKKIPDEADLNCLKEVLSSDVISNRLKNSVVIALGKYYTQKKEYELAKGYFEVLDIEKVEVDLDWAIDLMCGSGDIEQAYKIYIQKSSYTDVKTTLKLCTNMIQRGFKLKECARFSISLVENGCTETVIIDNILKNYEGSVQEYQKVIKLMQNIGIYSQEILEKTFYKAIEEDYIDENIKEIFTQIYPQICQTDYAEKFMEIMEYKVLFEEENILPRLREFFEKEYLKGQDEYLLYLLAAEYIKNNLIEGNEEIIAQAVVFMKEKNIIFPIFKKFKDKVKGISYLEENTPFIYAGERNKNVVLKYRIKGENLWRSRQMQYEKFGIYMTSLIIFYDEIIEYYIEAGKEKTSICEISSKELPSFSHYMKKEFYNINLAEVYSKFFEYSKVEKILTENIEQKKYLGQFGNLV